MSINIFFLKKLIFENNVFFKTMYSFKFKKIAFTQPPLIGWPGGPMKTISLVRVRTTISQPVCGPNNTRGSMPITDGK